MLQVKFLLLFLIFLIIPIAKAEIIQDSTYKIEIVMGDANTKLSDSTYEVGISSGNINEIIEDSTYKIYFGYWFPRRKKGVAVAEAEIEEEAIVTGGGEGGAPEPVKPINISELNITELLEALKPYLTEGELYDIRLYIPSLWVLDTPNYVFADLIFKNKTIKPNIEKVFFYLTTDCNTSSDVIEIKVGEFFDGDSYVTQLTIPSDYGSNTYCVTVMGFHGGIIERADVKIDFGKKTVYQRIVDAVKGFLFGKKVERVTFREQLIRLREWKFWDFLYGLLFGKG